MAALASPTPISFSSSANEFPRPATRPLSRTAYSRSHGNRSPQRRQPPSKESSGDSSDDDDLAPIKLSAEAQAILGEDNSQAGSDKENVHIYARQRAADKLLLERRSRTPLEHALTVAARTQGSGSPAPRVVAVSAAPRPALTTIARDGSFMYKTHDKYSTMPPQPANDSHTPPQPKRVIRVSTGQRAPRSSPAPESVEPADEVPAAERDGRTHPQSPEERTIPDEDVNGGPSTVARPRKGDENGAHSTMRVRRIGVGSMLGKPLRRGMIRRPSEDDQTPLDQPEHDLLKSPEIEMGRRAKEPDLLDHPDLDLPYYGSPQLRSRAVSAERNKQRPVSLPHHALEPHSPIQFPLSTSVNKTKPTPASNGSHPSTRSSSSQRKPTFKIPALPPLPSEHDQENEPPPTFKKSKSSVPSWQIHEDQVPTEEKATTAPAPISPERQPLALRSNNTPHRPAPAPPPKMSLLEAATSNTNSRKKQPTHVVINGKQYRRLDCIGRGGSSRVFRVMADNFKIFAMKRVNLDDADMAAIAGYKGEIDLLRKLENEDRVIRLFDYEINEEKALLNVLMELGETDFNKMLNEQLKSDNAKLDVIFTRHYWKEMLLCVRAVHKQGIVHSDLKPANFLLVKGQLKLIDFGIANAIQDNTVNVHRENQIGTPNYMSPESLICQNVSVGPNGEGVKDIKLGRPSDVWSLGCILYQMTYGQPPFAHIQQQMQRIMAIPNPKVEIMFPARGVGGVVVPFGLIKTLRRCLDRDVGRRPSVEELLSEEDPFLCPVAISPEMLGRVIGNVVGYCRRREEGLRKKGEGGEEGDEGRVSCLPRDEEMRGWPGAFYEKLRQAQEEGTAW